MFSLGNKHVEIKETTSSILKTRALEKVATHPNIDINAKMTMDNVSRAQKKSLWLLWHDPPPGSTQASPLTWMLQTFSCCCECYWPEQSPDVFLICETQTPENGQTQYPGHFPEFTLEKSFYHWSSFGKFHHRFFPVSTSGSSHQRECKADHMPVKTYSGCLYDFHICLFSSLAHCFIPDHRGEALTWFTQPPPHCVCNYCRTTSLQ